MVVGSIFGDMSIRYRKVSCVSITGSNANVVEHTTGDAFSTSLAISPTRRPTEFPVDCWTDVTDTVFYDPVYARNIALIVIGCGFILTILYTIVGSICCAVSNCCDDCDVTRITNEDKFRCATGTCVFFFLLLLVGGAVIGSRFNTFGQGTCMLFRMHRPGFTDMQKNNYWEVSFSTPFSSTIEYHALENSSPRPYDGGPCWTNGSDVTFNDPYLVMVWFFLAYGILLTVSIGMGVRLCR